MKKIFMLCVTLIMLSNCSQFTLLASGTSLAISQNTYAKMYNSVDMLMIMSTEKSIKEQVYERGKKYIYEKNNSRTGKRTPR
jgi:hypothetical protein